MDVFVSFSSKDQAVADAIVAALERAGITCWYAPRDIPPGKDYGDVILEAVRTSRAVVAVVSGSAVGSPHVLRELERAIHYRVPIVPIRIDDVEIRGAFELFLSVVHRLDAQAPPLERHLLRLVDVVRATLGGAPAEAPGVTAPPAPAPARSSPAPEISPDGWSRRPAGAIRRFLSNLLEDSES